MTEEKLPRTTQLVEKATLVFLSVASLSMFLSALVCLKILLMR